MTTPPPNREIASVLTRLLAKVPGATSGLHLGRTNFLVGEKVFAFVREGEVALKLPAETIAELIQSGRAERLVMGKRAMKEWAVLRHDDPQAFAKDLDLFRQSAAFAAEPAPKTPKRRKG